MSESERKILLGSGVLPLMLGGNLFTALLFSIKLYIKHGVCSVFCGKASRVVSALNPKCGALSSAYMDNSRLFSEQLSDFATENDELTVIIVPMSNKAKRLVSDLESELECRYIISEGRSSLLSHPLFSKR